jgi:predicted DNA binding CopG/RHH family protein
MNKLKRIPKFESEMEERKFWQRVDSTHYVDYSKAEKWVFPNLKFSSVPITIRMPESLLDRVKIKAHQKDVPYQTLIKQFIHEGLN